MRHQSRSLKSLPVWSTLALLLVGLMSSVSLQAATPEMSIERLINTITEPAAGSPSTPVNNYQVFRVTTRGFVGISPNGYFDLRVRVSIPWPTNPNNTPQMIVDNYSVTSGVSQYQFLRNANDLYNVRMSQLRKNANGDLIGYLGICFRGNPITNQATGYIVATLNPSDQINTSAVIMAGGSGSVPVTLIDPSYVNTPPTIATQPAASPSSVTSGNATMLSVLGADGGGESSLAYTWESDGPAPVTFGSANGTNGGKTVSATFSASGTYQFWVSVRDPDGAQINSVAVSVQVTLPATPPTIAQGASTTQNPTTGTSIPLFILGADSRGEESLTYAWSVTGTPPSAVTFSDNGTNAARATIALISKVGTYTFACTITNPTGQVITSAPITVTVDPLLSAVSMSIGTPTTNGRAMQFLTTTKDQFGLPMLAYPLWSTTGGGTINSSGLYQATAGTGGPYTVSAQFVNRSASASVYKTSTRLIGVSGDVLSTSGQPFSTIIAISGPAGNSTINILSGTKVGGGTSIIQGSPSQTTYQIIPNSGASSVSLAVGGTPISPPVFVPNIVIGAVNRGDGWPKSCVKFRGNGTSQVTINPPLTAGVTAKFGIANAGPNAKARILEPTELSGAGGQLKIDGLVQDDPGSFSTIVLLKADGGVTQIASPPFTVCAHVINWELYKGITLNQDPYYGMFAKFRWKSDVLWNGVPGGVDGYAKYLYNCYFLEKVELKSRDAAFKPVDHDVQKNPYVATPGAATDAYGAIARRDVNYGLSGSEIRHQIYVFQCDTCQSTMRVVMPGAGIIIEYRTKPDVYDHTKQTFQTLGTRATVTSHGFSSGPALGTDQQSDVIKLPPATP